MLNRSVLSERLYRLIAEVLPRNMEVPAGAALLIEELIDELEYTIDEFVENEVRNDSQLYL